MVEFEESAGLCRGTPCQAFAPGHNMHHIHASRVGRTPWGWRDAFVTSATSQVVRAEYLDGQVVLAWHHRALGVELGAPVRVHEEYHAVGSPFGWFNVIIRGGFGPVPEPPDAVLWHDRMSVGVVDMGMGNGLALDHAEPLDPT